jgi:hypothetical protein
VRLNRRSGALGIVRHRRLASKKSGRQRRAAPLGGPIAVQAAAAQERRIGQERHSTVSWDVSKSCGRTRVDATVHKCGAQRVGPHFSLSSYAFAERSVVNSNEMVGELISLVEQNLIHKH